MKRVKTGYYSSLLITIIALTLFGFASQLHASETETAVHGIAMHGDPALPENFTHLPYANPDAPKGGKIVYSATGSFDSVNPFILKGQKVRGLRDGFLGNNVYESLLSRSQDEAFSLYGLLAEKVILPEDRSSIEYLLNPNAKFSDGAPVTVEDVIFTVELLAEKGRPNYRQYYSLVADVSKTGPHSVKFTFKEKADRELPLLISLMPILPKHLIDPETFDQTTLKPIPGSGPYILSDVEQGKQIILKRNPDYWGKDLPIKRGLHNFDEIRIDYYRDSNALFEAFKKGLIDVHFEGDPVKWKEAYRGPSFDQGDIVKTSFVKGSPNAMRGYAFNTRREPLNDIRVRQALSLLFDFEWMNTNLFNNGYARTHGFFDGSELSAIGVPADPRERELLQEYLAEVDESVFNGTYQIKKTDGSGRDRTVLREALQLLRQSGFSLENGQLMDRQGNPLSLDLLIPSTDDRIASAFQENLKSLGIRLGIRGVDAAQFEERRKSFDFDLIVWTWAGSLSPGNEQYFRWGSNAADQPGSFNMVGVKSKAVDAMIDALLQARERGEFISAVRALDRLLISGYYVLPHYHLGEQLVAHSKKLKYPNRTSLYGVSPTTWWIEE